MAVAVPVMESIGAAVAVVVLGILDRRAFRLRREIHITTRRALVALAEPVMERA